MSKGPEQGRSWPRQGSESISGVRTKGTWAEAVPEGANLIPNSGLSLGQECPWRGRQVEKGHKPVLSLSPTLTVLSSVMAYRGLTLGSSCIFQICPPVTRARGRQWWGVWQGVEYPMGSQAERARAQLTCVHKRQHLGFFLLDHLRCEPIW